ncbi:MAG: hypothetical protein ALECFALPRED_004183 [Alectoria fallacina]|uniref:Protein HRI1 n=1 Tax=Alectoria fallacina TaxID=1903189 RepID=A0A8H3IUV6_9LECA|nr:MAG: hypothetical protein ALECFALPRED_004183 [Alectoria fallacina]
MGVPTISERKHYRLLPAEPEEPTSTIVLTSKDSYFIDVRILRGKLEQEKNQEANTESCLNWAFAGKSHTTFSQDSSKQLSHTVWDHWIDSRSNNPDSDEGDMWVQPNGDILEKGKNSDPVSGEETEYEELWHDLQVEAFGKKHNRSSLVMRADQPERMIRGMAVKIGGWCEGLLKIGDGLTVERWEWRSTDSASNVAPTEASKEEKRTHNDWIRTFRLGDGTLPCKDMCSRSFGKFGLNAVLNTITNNDWKSDIEWKVVEEYYW